uniref:TIGR03668 family PPOX class F420-dependent oxidoreductase n=1 Tax=Nocardia paucivorans TaxID=114259 RepID=UPI000303F5C0|nr:TIGR03668 family PPOX class F420-dependent oxidoreductase [Nocardia paucivorans]
MRLSEEQARERFAQGRVARLATVTRSGNPHLVPIVFAAVGDIVYTSVDAKPKSTTALRRLENIAANPNVAVLVDHYSEDWDRLWWVRADGTARLVEADEARTAVEQLTARYPVYRTQPPPGPVLAIRVTRWLGWSAG